MSFIFAHSLDTVVIPSLDSNERAARSEEQGLHLPFIYRYEGRDCEVDRRQRRSVSYLLTVLSPGRTSRQSESGGRAERAQNTR
jgi:hypothetical protein